MSLAPGGRLGAYEIVQKIGEGGMGEVYRALDTALGRFVAIKVLPEAFAADPDRLLRFEREARTLASLNHPHIAQIYGLERTASSSAIAMELVEGPTLAARLAQGPIPVDEALSVGRQIAAGLEAAHDKGIVHRDLKPSNIAFTADGQVKVLDFGLAKLAGDVSPPSSGSASYSPTMTSPDERLHGNPGLVTGAGTLLGTAAYMSPEQARGKSVDARADIWGFGAVLFEMLTATRAFAGDDVSETIARILRDEPDWSRLPAGLPPAVRAFLKRSLHKDPEQRVHDIADMRLAIEGAFNVDSVAAPVRRSGASRVWQFVGALLLLLTAMAAVVGWLRPPAPPGRDVRETRRFPLTLPSSEELPAGVGGLLSVSPDGQTLMYLTSDGDVFRLFRRHLDQLESAPIPGTDDAGADPFFSHDGRWVGFHVGAALMKISLAGGRPVRLANLPVSDPRGASWTADETIVIGARRKGLVRVSAHGGDLTTLVEPDDDREYWYPQVLPGGRAVLFTATQPAADAGDVLVFDVDTRERRTLVRDAVAGHYLSTGHLAFVRGGDVWAVRFDLDRLEAIGEPAIVQSNVRVEFGGAVQVAIAGDGSIAYVPREVASAPLTLVWVDRRGGEEPLAIDPHVFESPRVSPDGGRVAVVMRGADVADVAGVWIYDLVRRVLSRLTLDPGEDESPLWSPDGRQILYAATRGGDRLTLQRAADGSGEESRVTASVGHHHLSALAPDGRTLAFEVRAGNSASWDVWLSVLGSDAEPRALLATPATERGATFSPDGRWLAYESGESGQSEIYVRAVTGDAGRWQISADGGTEALWSPAGRELFYRSGDRLMVVDVQTGPAFSASRARPLFEGRYARLAWGVRNYDVSPDGQRFLMLKTIGRGDPHRIVLVQNWDAEVNRLLPP